MSNAELIAHMRREHDRLIPRNFPDQGYDWRTPMTAMLGRVPELLDILESTEAERDAALADARRVREHVALIALVWSTDVPALLTSTLQDIAANTKATS